MSIRIIACGVFRDALEQIIPDRLHPNIVVTYITPYLHNHPQELKAEILNQIHLAQKTKDRIMCLYGRCYPDLDDHLFEWGIFRIPGDHCYEILLGSPRFRAVIEKDAGTYFIEKDLILNFNEYCIQPLELNDPVLRESYFKNYSQLAYIRQPSDPENVIEKVHGIARLLDLTPMVIEADYSQLSANLLRFFEKG